MDTETRQRLLDAAVETIREQGITGTSARTIAATAGANQALVFYHFGTVDNLLVEACSRATAARVAHYRPQLDFVELGSTFFTATSVRRKFASIAPRASTPSRPLP